MAAAASVKHFCVKVIKYLAFVAEKMLCQPDDADAEADEADLLFMPSMDSVLSGNSFVYILYITLHYIEII